MLSVAPISRAEVTTTNRAQQIAARIERAIRNELDLANVAVSDAFPMFMHIGDVIRLLIHDHLTDYGYRAGRIPLGRELPLAMRFFRENAHDCLMICAVAGEMDWRVDEAKVIHFWVETKPERTETIEHMNTD